MVPLTGQSFDGGWYIALDWDLQSDSQIIGYIIYVGTESGKYTESFVIRGQTFFVYPNAVPGRRYYFAVAAYAANFLVSPLSEEVSGYGQSTPALVSPEPVSGATAIGRTSDSASRALTAQLPPSPQACAEDVDNDCYSSAVVGTFRDGPITAIAPIGDGRVLAIQSGERVLIVLGNAWRPLTVPESNIRLGGLAISPRYAENHYVFVEEIESLPDFTRQLSIVRYREVENTLGERAVLVTGVQLPPAGAVPFTIDSEGRMFIAVPSNSTAEAPYGGFVQAFESDGSVSRRNRAASPVVARGFAQPAGIAADTTAGRLWLSGTDPNASSPLAWVPLAPVSGVWPPDPQPLLIRWSSRSAPTAPFSSARQSTRNPIFLPLPEESGFVRIDDDLDSRATIISIPGSRRISSVISGGGDAAYLAEQGGQDEASRILRIVRPPSP